METATWTVVQFVEDGTVEAVPTNWIDGNVCYWPPLHGSRLMTAIKKMDSRSTSWSQHIIRIFENSTFDNYKKARGKARTAEDTSDLQSEVEHHRRVNQPTLSSSIESYDEDTIIATPPQLKRKRMGSMVSHGDSEESLMAEQSIVGNQEAGHSTESSETFLQTMKSIERQGHVLRALLTDVLQEIKTLRQEVSEIKEAGTKKPVQDDRVPFLQRFPSVKFLLDTDEEFSNFENILNSGEQFQDGVQELYKIGGENAYQFVKRILSTLITNKLAVSYSWLGRKGKKPFNELNMAKLVISAAEKGMSSSTRRTTEIAIQMWLKRAGDRIAAQMNKKF